VPEIVAPTADLPPLMIKATIRKPLTTFIFTTSFRMLILLMFASYGSSVRFGRGLSAQALAVQEGAFSTARAIALM
jgi:hypothetical protein